MIEKIEIDQITISNETLLKTGIIAARQQESVQIIKANGVKVKTEIEAKTEITKKSGIAEADIAQKKVSAEMEAQTMMIKAQANQESSDNFASALMTAATSESENGESIAKLRHHRERMQRSNSETNLAQKSKMVISGKSGENLMDYYREAAMIAKSEDGDE
jgi:hypothetical protein